MAGAIFKVETADLRKSAQLIEDRTTRYDAEWAKIYSEIASLRVEWQGQSSEQFNKQIEAYRNDFQELATVLRSYADFLKTTADRIEKTEDAIKGSAAQLHTGR